jgi:outer membrane protein TolC
MQAKINVMSKSKTAPQTLAICVFSGLCLLFLAAQVPAHAQGNTGPAQQKQPSGANTAPNSSPVANAQQNLYNASGQNGAQPTQDSFHGSIVDGKATDGVLDLSLSDAVQRGLRQNLGLILQNSSVKNANGQRLEELQALLPTVNATASYEVQQINLAAFGLSFPGLHPIVGPFQVFDFRAYLTQNLVNVSALKNYIAAKHNFEGSKLTAEDARDLKGLTRPGGCSPRRGHQPST